MLLLIADHYLVSLFKWFWVYIDLVLSGIDISSTVRYYQPDIVVWI